MSKSFFILIVLAVVSCKLETCGSIKFKTQLNHTIKSGYSSQNATNSPYFLFYGAINKTQDMLKTTPLIIWISGSNPGQSSVFDSFYGFGPYSIENSTEKVRKNTLNDKYSLLVIDFPFGTGASVTDKKINITNTEQVVQNLYPALENFIVSCLNLSDTKIYIHSYGYATRWIPSLVQALTKIKVAGVSLGELMFDTKNMLKNLGMFSYNMGLVDYWERPNVEKGIQQILQLANANQNESAVNMLSLVQAYIMERAGGITLENLRKYQKDISQVEKTNIINFLNDKTNQGVYFIDQSVVFSSGNTDITKNFINDFFQDQSIDLEVIIANKTKTLLYNSQDNLQVPIASTILYIDSLNTVFKKEFYEQDFKQWQFNNQTIGHSKKTQNLEYKSLNKAGAFSFYDNPSSFNLMIDQFISE